MILSDLLSDVLGRVEEFMPPDGPVFWKLNGEVYAQMVDGLFEAALVSGVVQLASYQITLQPNTSFFALQLSTNGLWAYGAGGGGYSAPQVIPKGIIAPIRMRASSSLRKTTLKGLDDMVPDWQQAAPANKLKAWFPLGVSGFGIYPQLTQAENVIMDFLYSPVNAEYPYSGTEAIPLQEEFADLLPKYAAAMLRAKEGGADAEEAGPVFADYLNELKNLSLFQMRIDQVVFGAPYGAVSTVNPKTST